MAYEFADGSTNVVDCGSGASIDAFTTHTLWLWLYPIRISATSNRVVCSKGSVGAFRKEYGLRTTGQLDMAVNGATDVACRSVASPGGQITAGKWWFIVFQLSAGLVGSIFIGSETSPVREVSGYASRVTGVTLDSDAAGTFRIGNAAALDACGDTIISDLGYHSVAFPLATLEAIRQNCFRFPLSTTGAVWHLGYEGPGTIRDWTGNGNTGTASGAVRVPRYTPRPVPLRDLLAAQPTGGRASKNIRAFPLGVNLGMGLGIAG